MELARYMIAGSFIVISGVCARLSRRPLRRGLIVLAAALLVSAVTYLIGAPVYWGILHLLGVCMLLYAAVRKRWEPLPGIYACGAALLIFALTFMLPIRVRVGVPFLFPFGLRTAAFASADYYPLLPWGALFFAAAAAGERLGDMPPEKKYASAPRALAWLSRRSLLIYLVHQPCCSRWRRFCSVRRRGLDTRIFWVYSPDIGVEGKRPEKSAQRGTRFGESVLRTSPVSTVPEPVGGNARPFDRVMGQ